MNPALFPLDSFNSSEEDLNAYIFDLLSQQSSAPFGHSFPATYNGFDGLFTANGDLPSAGLSFGSDPLADFTWDDYFLITDGPLLEGASSFDTPMRFAPGVPDISTSGGPSVFNVAARSTDITTSGATPALTFGDGSTVFNTTIDSPTISSGSDSFGINMPVGFPILSPADASTDMVGIPWMSNLRFKEIGISMPGALPTFDFTAGSTNMNMPVGPQMLDIPAEIGGVDVPVSLQTTMELSYYREFDNGGFPCGTNVEGSIVTGSWVGTNQQVHQPINGVHAPLALSIAHFDMSSSSKTNLMPATSQLRHGYAPSPQAVPNTYSKSTNMYSETQSPPKRSRSSSPSARPPPKRRKDWRKGSQATLRFVHDERSMPANFRANPDNHGRFQYTATGRRKYLNGPEAVQERRRRLEGNVSAK